MRNVMNKMIAITLFLLMTGTAYAGQIFYQIEDIPDQVIAEWDIDGAFVVKYGGAILGGFVHQGSFSGWGDLSGYTDLSATLTFTWHDDTVNWSFRGFFSELVDPDDGYPFNDLAKVILDGNTVIDGVEVGLAGSTAPTVHQYVMTDLSLLDDGLLNYMIDVSDIEDARMDFIVDSVALEITGNPVPVPGAIWLMGTGLMAIAGLGRKRNG